MSGMAAGGLRKRGSPARSWPAAVVAPASAPPFAALASPEAGDALLGADPANSDALATPAAAMPLYLHTLPRHPSFDMVDSFLIHRRACARHKTRDLATSPSLQIPVAMSSPYLHNRVDASAGKLFWGAISITLSYNPPLSWGNVATYLDCRFGSCSTFV